MILQEENSQIPEGKNEKLPRPIDEQTQNDLIAALEDVGDSGSELELPTTTIDSKDLENLKKLEPIVGPFDVTSLEKSKRVGSFHPSPAEQDTNSLKYIHSINTDPEQTKVETPLESEISGETQEAGNITKYKKYSHFELKKILPEYEKTSLWSKINKKQSNADLAFVYDEDYINTYLEDKVRGILQLFDGKQLPLDIVVSIICDSDCSEEEMISIINAYVVFTNIHYDIKFVRAFAHIQNSLDNYIALNGHSDMFMFHYVETYNKGFSQLNLVANNDISMFISKDDITVNEDNQVCGKISYEINPDSIENSDSIREVLDQMISDEPIVLGITQTEDSRKMAYQFYATSRIIEKKKDITGPNVTDLGNLKSTDGGDYNDDGVKKLTSLGKLKIVGGGILSDSENAMLKGMTKRLDGLSDPIKKSLVLELCLQIDNEHGNELIESNETIVLSEEEKIAFDQILDEIDGKTEEFKTNFTVAILYNLKEGKNNENPETADIENSGELQFIKKGPIVELRPEKIAKITTGDESIDNGEGNNPSKLTSMPSTQSLKNTIKGMTPPVKKLTSLGKLKIVGGGILSDSENAMLVGMTKRLDGLSDPIKKSLVLELCLQIDNEHGNELIESDETIVLSEEEKIAFDQILDAIDGTTTEFKTNFIIDIISNLKDGNNSSKLKFSPNMEELKEGIKRLLPYLNPISSYRKLNALKKELEVIENKIIDAGKRKRQESISSNEKELYLEIIEKIDGVSYSIKKSLLLSLSDDTMEGKIQIKVNNTVELSEDEQKTLNQILKEITGTSNEFKTNLTTYIFLNLEE